MAHVSLLGVHPQLGMACGHSGRSWPLDKRDQFTFSGKYPADLSPSSRNVQVNAHGEGFRVSALRSSAIKCVDESDYYLDVEHEGDQWVIVEEYSETVSLSRCEPSQELAESLSEVREKMRPHLPLDLDADTRLESVEVVGSALIYNQRLHTVAASEVPLDKAEAILKQIGVQNACGTAEVAALIRDGATVRYATVGRHGEKLATVDISRGLCSAFAQ